MSFRTTGWVCSLVVTLVFLCSTLGSSINASTAITVDAKVSSNRNSPATNVSTSTFSTHSGNELLLAFISSDAYSSGTNVSVTSVNGSGLTWVLVARSNMQLGTAEIWRTFSVAPLANVSVTAALSQSVASSITVMSFAGVNTSGTFGSGAVGARGTSNASSGAPASLLTTTANNSWVLGVGDDWDKAIGRTPGMNQTLVNQFLTSNGDTYWVQAANSPTALSGTRVTINDVAPAGDRYNLSIVEVLADNNATLIPPTITAQPTNQTVTAGQSATFTVLAAGSAPLTYQWQKSGVNISGATSTSYTTPATITSDSGSTFDVVVTNAPGIVTSVTATLTVNAAAVAPTISTQPLNQTVTAGQSVTFTVLAAGSAPLTYQWHKSGVNISGATSTSYTTPTTVMADSGSTFVVVVTNAAGTVTSATATLTVNAAPVSPTITTQPLNQTVTAGQSATFTVLAAGTAPLTYQWQKSGVNISGATSPSYVTPTTVMADSGATFDVTVSNNSGNVTGNAATLTVNPAPSGCLTSSGTWVNTPLSSPQAGSFQLTFDATPSATTIDAVTGLSSGPATGFTNLAAIVRFNNAGQIDARNGAVYSAASPISYSAGTTYRFTLDVNVPTHTYSAYVMVGSVQTTIGLNFAFRTEQAGVLSLNNVGAQSSLGSQTICNIGLAGVTIAPTITTQPLSKTVAAGQTATFAVLAAGTAPLGYQWQKGGVNIAGATSATYVTPATSTSDSGSTFDVVVTNGSGAVTSTTATLTVTPAAVPIIQVSLSAINFGNSVVGTNLTQPLIINNTGTSTLTISQVALTGLPFSASGFSLPLTIAAGQHATMTVAFLPTSAGAFTGSVSLVSNAATSPTPITLTGTGIASILTLGMNPTSLAFGNVKTNTSSPSQIVTITNTGNSSVTISGITAAGAGYSISGGSTPVTLAVSQTLALSTLFNPTVVGSVTGSISIASNATGSPASIALTGTGVASIQHSATLSWTASTSTVSGYNVYRSTVSGSAYALLNPSLLSALTYIDSSVQTGTTYFYVTTAVDSSGNESIHSNEVSAGIP